MTLDELHANSTMTFMVENEATTQESMATGWKGLVWAYALAHFPEGGNWNETLAKADEALRAHDDKWAFVEDKFVSLSVAVAFAGEGKAFAWNVEGLTPYLKDLLRGAPTQQVVEESLPEAEEDPVAREARYQTFIKQLAEEDQEVPF